METVKIDMSVCPVLYNVVSLVQACDLLCSWLIFCIYKSAAFGPFVFNVWFVGLWCGFCVFFSPPTSTIVWNIEASLFDFLFDLDEYSGTNSINILEIDIHL